MSDYIIAWLEKTSSHNGAISVKCRDYKVFNGDDSSANRASAVALFEQLKASPDRVISVSFCKIIEGEIVNANL